MNETTKTILTILGSGAFLTFLQFLITRFDNKNNKFKELEKRIDDGLEEREKTGKNRYDEHKIAIEKMTVEHQKDFQALQDAIQRLAQNDSKLTESIQQIAEKQDIMADANVGMIHNTLIRFSDPIIERGAVTYDELSTLDSLYVPYSKLGGNGACKRRYEDINKLEKVSDEKAIMLDRDLTKRKRQEEEEYFRTG
jgi:hypothetical protein